MNQTMKDKLCEVLNAIDEMMLVDVEPQEKIDALSSVVEHATLHVIPIAVRKMMQPQIMPMGCETSKTKH